MTDQTIMTWYDFELFVKALARKIKEARIKLDSVCGIPRGGLVVAVRLSHLLDLPLVLEPRKKSLLADDISDSGETMKIWHKKFPHCPTATLWIDPDTEFMPDFWVAKTKPWAVFPWERK